MYKQGPQLSIEKTRDLIDECLSAYLKSRLESSNSPNSTDHARIRDVYVVDSGASFSTEERSAHEKVCDLSLGFNIPSPSRAPPLPPTAQESSPASEIPPCNGFQPQTQSPSRSIFRPLENYIRACFTNVECLNRSFSTQQIPQLRRTVSENTRREAFVPSRAQDCVVPDSSFPELDAKTLLLGDFAENGLWWTGRGQSLQQGSSSRAPQANDGRLEEKVTAKTSRIDWAGLTEWFSMVTSAGSRWRYQLQEIQARLFPAENIATPDVLSGETLEIIEHDIAEASAHVQRTLLKATENVLRRPGRPLRKIEDCRFLLILLVNPLLSWSELDSRQEEVRIQIPKTPGYIERRKGPAGRFANAPSHGPSDSHQPSPSKKGGTGGRHSGIVKRILGLLANLPSECHHRLVVWFSRFPEDELCRLVDLVGGFVTYRLLRQHGRKRSDGHDPHGGLIPDISGPGAGSSAQLHAAIGASGSQKLSESKDARASYSDDWQVKAAAKVMSLLFSANIQTASRLKDAGNSLWSSVGRTRAGSARRNGPHRHGQLLPISAFYNTFLDDSDLVADFEAWESRRGKFSFCQYPMFLSIWAKIHIMEYDVRRQMELKAREAFFNSILSRRAISQYLVLKVRRDCLVEDSLRSVSEVVGSGQDDIKKGLRIDFIGEEGLDSGGLRKEWFLLLVRDVFDPEHGLFVYDDESRYCYFNANSFETSDQFFLVGVVLGLAIYNSTILDVALPPFAFRKLLASAPNYNGPATLSVRSTHTHTLEDLAEFRPSLARGLEQMLEFDGDVEETFCRDFVAVVERYGHVEHVPLCPNGEDRTVNNSNRYEFVDLYVKYVLDTSVTRQYEPFKRGFFSVCEGNALSLFRPEEIELLVRGSDESLDVSTLRTVAVYDGWGKDLDPNDEPVVTWFWDTFFKANAKDQRKLLSFITSSDRIPAMGVVCLTIKITCLGDDRDRLPIARTCFNMLGLYRYQSRDILETKLWTAVNESEGFGMK